MTGLEIVGAVALVCWVAGTAVYAWLDHVGWMAPRAPTAHGRAALRLAAILLWFVVIPVVMLIDEADHGDEEDW